MVASVISRSCWSGAIVQSIVLKIGRSHREPPATASIDLQQRFDVRHLADLVLQVPAEAVQ